LVSDIPAWDGKITNLFYSVYTVKKRLVILPSSYDSQKSTAFFPFTRSMEKDVCEKVGQNCSPAGRESPWNICARTQIVEVKGFPLCQNICASRNFPSLWTENKGTSREGSHAEN
jgi:hypothetical protein